MVRWVVNKSTFFLSTACALLLPSALFAEVLAFKLNGIAHRNTELVRVDLYDDGNHQYYTSSNGQALRLDPDLGKLVSIGTLPTDVGATGCAIGKNGNRRDTPLYLAGAPDVNTPTGTRAGKLQLVDLTTGQGVGTTFTGDAPYSQLGKQIIGLGEREFTNNGINTAIAYFAVSEERTTNSAAYSQVKIFTVEDGNNMAAPVLSTCSQFQFEKQGFGSAPHMVALNDVTGDGVNELLVIAPTCTGNCNHDFKVQVIDPVICDTLPNFYTTLTSFAPYATIRSIEHLGDFYGNGKQHVAVASSGSGYTNPGGVQILEIAPSGAMAVTHTIPAPDQTFGFSMAYNGVTLAISSPYTDYYPNVNTTEGAIHLVDRGTHHIRDTFGGGRLREYQIGGNLQFIERDGISLLASTSLSTNPKMDLFYIDGESLPLSRTACSNFQRNLNPHPQVAVEFTPVSIEFSITGLETNPHSKSFLYIDAGNPYNSSPYFQSWGGSCNTTMRFQETISSPELSVNARGEATFSIPYVSGSIPHWNERGLTAAVATFVLPQTGNISFSSSNEVHFTLP